MHLLLLLACQAPEHPESPRPAPAGDADPDELPDTGPVDEVPPEDPAAFLFSDTPVDLALTLDEAAIAGLATSADESPPDVPATFTWGTESLQIEVRLKGGQGSFRTFDQKPSFTLDFEGSVPDQRFKGLRHLHLNNLVQDTSMLGEHAAYALFAARALAAPRHGYARLTVNGEPYGLYGIVDKVDGDLLRHAFGREDGLLLEGEMDDFHDYAVDDYAVVRDGGHPDPHAHVLEVVAALDAAPADARGAVLSAWFDRDRLLDAMATELVSGNDDGYVTWINNYFLWKDPDAGRFTLIPWGPDQAFSARLDVTDAHRGRLWDECRADAECDADLRERLRAAVAVFEDPAFRTRMEAIAATTLDDCLADPRSETAGDACEHARTEFFAFLDERPAEVRAALDAAP